MSSHPHSDAAVRDRLAHSLPHWRLERGMIRRTYRTHGWTRSMLVANAIGHLAEAAWHHPELTVSFSAVEVSLTTHDAGGITDKDFELAEKIEDLVLWQPRGGALEAAAGAGRPGYVRRD
ncbi:MAG TPA: 4a-hydroxytetrahydrobiopterin dehydratase [Methylomirabilota bacterium]|nr:4a-hydroxytetrahydrobiopterin dehydratase [Methylomirabilota bacterium]